MSYHFFSKSKGRIFNELRVSFKENYKMIAIEISKQQAPHADPRAIQQINFTTNLDRAGNIKMLFIIEEAKGTVLDCSQGTVKVL